MERTIIAMSYGSWGRGKTVAEAMKQLKKAGGTTAKGKLLLRSCPPGAWIDDHGGTNWKDPDDIHEPPFSIDRNGNRLDATLAKQLV